MGLTNSLSLSALPIRNIKCSSTSRRLLVRFIRVTKSGGVKQPIAQRPEFQAFGMLLIVGWGGRHPDPLLHPRFEHAVFARPQRSGLEEGERDCPLCTRSLRKTQPLNTTSR